MGMFTLCHYIFEVQNFFGFLSKTFSPQLKFALNLNGDLRLGFLNSAGTVKTLRTAGDGPNALCT
jgi:hypothetical protein